MAAPPVALIGIVTAILMSPWFSFSGNALSDLGVHSAAGVFNSTLILTGFLCIVFVIGLYQAFRQSVLKRAGAAIFMIAAVALVCIGVFHEGYGSIHFVVSLAFFALTPLSILVISAGMLARPDTHMLGYLSLAVVAVAVGAWLVPWGMGIAVPEAIAAAAGCIWLIVMAVRVYLYSDVER